MRIALIADFHVGPYKRADYVRKVVEKTASLNADVIMLAGDFLFDSRYGPEDLEPLKDLKAPLGVFAVMGNHDSGKHLEFKLFGRAERYDLGDRTRELTRYLESLDIKVLRNTSVQLTHAGKTFVLAGIDDVWMESCDLPRALKDAGDMPVILMAHNPDVIMEAESRRANLIVSGHTHGGQVRLPMIGSIAKIPTKIGREYDRGIFTLLHGNTIAITQGCGETMARARLFCPPEIMIVAING